MKWGDGDDAVFEFGVEEAGFGADAFSLAGEEAVFGLFVCGEVGEIVEHPAEFFVELLGWELAGRELGVVFDEGEAGGEFAGAEAGLVEALPLASAALEHVEMFARDLVGGHFGSVFLEAAVADVEVGFDEVGDIAEEGGSSLLAVFRVIGAHS